MNEKSLKDLPFVGIERCWIKNFKNKDWTWGWINDAGEILKDWYQYCAPFFWGFWRFRINGTEWWINTKWEIIKEGCMYCGDFNGWHDGFLKEAWEDSKRNSYIEDWKEFTVNYWCCFEWFAVFSKNGVRWWMDNSGNILAEWFRYCDNFYEWFAVFEDEKGKRGWIDKSWKIWKDGYSKTKKFNEWFAVFEDEKWKSGWISKFWNILKDSCIECSMFKYWQGEFSLEENVDDSWNKIESSEDGEAYCHLIDNKWKIEYNICDESEWSIDLESYIETRLREYVEDFNWKKCKYKVCKFEDWIYWWINESGKVLSSWFKSCWDFHNGFAVFRRFDDTFGWIDLNGNILSEWYSLCLPFWKSEDDYLGWSEYESIDEFETDKEDYEYWKLLWHWEKGSWITYINTDWSIYDDTRYLKYDRFNGDTVYYW